MKSKLERMGRACARHPWLTIVAWVIVLGIAVYLNVTLLGSALTTTGSDTNDPESARAQALLRERLQGPDQVTELVILRSEQLTVDQPAFAARMADVAADLRALGPGVVQQVVTYNEMPDPLLLSKDHHAAIIPVVMAGTPDDAMEQVEKVIAEVRAEDGVDGFETLIAGGASIGHDMMAVAERDAKNGEMIGIGVALFILVLVFGALVAATVPLVLAGVAVVVALGLTALLGQFWQLTFTVTEIISMMGLAVGIDYSLFVVSRFREERDRGRGKLDAIGRAQATAGRAVLFSGLTVVVAVTGLLLMPSTVFRSLAAGAALVVSIAILAGLTLLPAILSLLGDRVNAVQPRRFVRRVFGAFSGGTRKSAAGEAVGATGGAAVGAGGGVGASDRGFWSIMTRAVMRRPVVALLAGILPLAIAASFYLDINPGSSGAAALPEGAESKTAFMMLEKDFSFGLLSPVEVVVDGPAGHDSVKKAVERLQSAVNEDDAFADGALVRVNPAGDLTAVGLSLAVDPNSNAAEEAVRRLRAELVPATFAGSPATVLVGGQTAMNVDFFTSVSDYTPRVFAFVLGLSFLLLMMVFRSLIVPINAILMNLLSVGSAYGLLVLVFQKGVGASLFGFQQTPRIEAWLPLFLFAVLFGLSMDYHVLLLSRIRERYDETGDNAESVAFGLRSTAGLITGAAVIMVAVFGGFAAGDLVMFQQMGFGLAVAVLFDATIVRSILVPASMKLLGKVNWWLPRPLHWLPDLRVEPQAQLEPVTVQEDGRR